MSGYRGFASKAEYEAYYSDINNYAHELPMMEAYARECEEERIQSMERSESEIRLECLVLASKVLKVDDSGNTVTLSPSEAIEAATNFLGFVIKKD